jgi:glycosyltransferase involved in cell wall biosynthesis
VPAALAEADIGIAPTRRDQYTDFSLSTKIFEYGAMRLPVVASRLPMVVETFGPDTVVTYEPGDPESIIAAIEQLIDDPADRERRIDATATLVAAGGWERDSAHYVELIESLAADRRERTVADPSGRKEQS